jgi:putative aldouronate transport system permease protein
MLLVKLGITDNKDLMNVKSFFRRSTYSAEPGRVWVNGSIIYLAALSGVDQELYEAAKIDGAGRWKQTIHITIPSISPTIIIMLILTISSLMNSSTEKIILLYRPLTYEVADVIGSFVYRRGLIDGDFDYGTSVGLFQSFISLLLLFLAK